MTDENMNQEVVEETDAAAVPEAEAEAVDVAVEAEAVAVDAPVEAEAAAVEPAVEESATEESAVEAEPVEVNPNFKWYVVHTYSGYENRAKQSLEERIRQEDMVNDFGEVLIPTENVVELGKGGQKKTTKRKFFPGYMLVQMDLNENTWHLVRGTPKVTGFVGGTTKPPAIPEIEVRRLTQQIDEGALQTKPRIHFEYGENVRVIDGAFQNFNGVVEAVDDDKAKVKVMVSIFGRSTPVELDFIQVEKA